MDKQIKEKFKKALYIKNTKCDNTTLLNKWIDKLGIEVHNNTRRWIDKNLIGFWGNQKVKCTNNSDKIFEVLDEVMQKVKR